MAMTPPLMSERDEPSGGGWYDCGWASALMSVYKRGYRAYPLGYGRNEREALERSQTIIAPEHGATPAAIDDATHRRYGLTLAKVADMATLAAYLKGPASRGILLGGAFTALPTWLKRWDPNFAGLHSVYVQPMGDGLHVRWMDPLATWGYGGDVIDWGTAFNFNNATNGKFADCRTATEPVPVPTPSPTPGVILRYGGYEGFRGLWRLAQNYTNIRSSPYIQSGNIIATLDVGQSGAGGWVTAGELSNFQTTDKGTLVNGSPRWLGDATGTKWVHVSVVTLIK